MREGASGKNGFFAKLQRIATAAFLAIFFIKQ
jgi:hypothetical protein